MKKFLDADDPFYRPLWVRVLIVGFCFAWAIFEFVTGSPFWGVIVLGLSAYTGFEFFLRIRPASSEKTPPDAD